MADKPSALHIRIALARHFDWFHNMMMPEWFIDGGQADLLFVSRAGYVTEIEIKIGFADWNADREKEKWKAARPHVGRFFYAVPGALAERTPDWLPSHVGVLVVTFDHRGQPRVRIVREAVRRKSDKLTPSELERMRMSCYYRFWRSELRRNLNPRPIRPEPSAEEANREFVREENEQRNRDRLRQESRILRKAVG